MIKNRFPNIKEKDEKNPAAQLFGHRFNSDQTALEYLAEFLLVFISEKNVGKESGWEKSFIDLETLKNIKDNFIKYRPPVRLILKLFSFLSSSKLETRHSCHKDQFEALNSILEERIELFTNIDKKKVLELIEQVLIGFVGVAQNRTWCAQTFLPLSTSLIAAETRWKETQAKNYPELKWEDALSEYFVFVNYMFMARGGELLFLQLCNLFRKSNDVEILNFIKNQTDYKVHPLELKKRLEESLSKLLSCVASIESLAQWIENSDPYESAKETDKHTAKCGWCPEESWPEAYFFAFEMLNICEATIDPLEKIEMLKFCCVFQVLRSLCSQSVRYWEDITEEEKEQGGINGFSWFVTDPETKSKPIKDAGKANMARVQKLIHGALRTKEPLQKEVNKGQSGYKRADEKGGQGLFIKLGKQIGFIAPITGSAPRFVMPESLLRYFVLSLIPPGNRMRLKTFKETLYKHFGIAIGGEQLESAMKWTYPNQSFFIHAKTEDWFEEKLRATGFLIPLSDSVSLVINPFIKSNY